MLRRTASLYATLLADIRFHDLLLACDQDLADTCRAEGCELCGGRLHSARYPRKPRGRACRLGPEHDLLRRRWMPVARDAGVAAVPRPPGLCRGHRRADRDPAAWRDGRQDGAPLRGRQRRPSHCGALAVVVAPHLHGHPVLAGRAPSSCRRLIRRICRHRSSIASPVMASNSSPRCCASSAPLREVPACGLDDGRASPAEDARRQRSGTVTTLGPP